jgi:hypothetical protein
MAPVTEPMTDRIGIAAQATDPRTALTILVQLVRNAPPRGKAEDTCPAGVAAVP